MIITVVLSIIFNVLFIIKMRDDTTCVFYTCTIISVITFLLFGLLLLLSGNVFFGIIILVIVALIFCYISKRKEHFQFLLGIVKSAAYFLKECLSLLYVPIITAVLEILYLFLVIGAIKNVYGTGKRVPIETGSPHGKIELDGAQLIQVIFSSFLLLWGCNFFNHLSQFIVSYASCNWYFSNGQDRNPLTRGVIDICKYHLGSVAFGSMVITIV